MKKILMAATVALLAMVALSSCTNENEQYWRCDGNITYNSVIDYNSFLSEYKALIDGPEMTISKAQREVGKLVNKYDGDLGGNVYFQTGPTENGPWTTKKTWTMTLR